MLFWILFIRFFIEREIADAAEKVTYCNSYCVLWMFEICVEYSVLTYWSTSLRVLKDTAELNITALCSYRLSESNKVNALLDRRSADIKIYIGSRALFQVLVCVVD